MYTPFIWYVFLCREKAPGQRECDDAIEVLNSCIREVDQASLAAISQQLTPREDISMEVITDRNQTHLHTHVELCWMAQIICETSAVKFCLLPKSTF